MRARNRRFAPPQAQHYLLMLCQPVSQTGNPPCHRTRKSKTCARDSRVRVECFIVLGQRGITPQTSPKYLQEVSWLDDAEGWDAEVLGGRSPATRSADTAKTVCQRKAADQCAEESGCEGAGEASSRKSGTDRTSEVRVWPRGHARGPQAHLRPVLSALPEEILECRATTR